MIKTEIGFVFHKETNEVEITRKVAMGGEREEIVRDLKSVGYALAKSARKRKLEEPEKTAERIQFEQALAEGFRMDAAEVKEMDSAAAEEMEEKIREKVAERLGEEFVRGWRS